jgi:hypothetical protein
MGAAVKGMLGRSPKRPVPLADAHPQRFLGGVPITRPGPRAPGFFIGIPYM